MHQIAVLAEMIARHIREDGVQATAIARLFLIRISQPSEPLHQLHAPALCIVVQGSKQVMLGDMILTYGPDQYLTVSTDLPVAGQVMEASPDRPYLCLRLDLDAVMLGRLIEEAGLGPTAAEKSDTRSGLAVHRMNAEVLDAVIRMLRLLDTPRDAAVLAPMAEREVLYRILLAGDAARLRQIAFADSSLRRVSRGIDWIKKHYSEPFSIDAVAGAAGMSPSSLHQHFKEVTALTPLQYQKQLRLQTARRLILNNAMDAASAGHEVGYNSPSQFSRDYRRLFGAPPLQDVARLRLQPDMTEQMLIPV